MVPSIAKAGLSFKGAMSYYLHDKGQETDARPTTAERVAWTETRNLATDGPQTATRIMIATAAQADELKAAAGVKASGRKSAAHVYAYSLAWHPDEAAKLDRAEMVRAVDSSLKALGAEAHQAVIICHRDQKHPHVHVVVNRVHPETGRMLATSNDRLKLSDWANAYERERGQILTPLREEKRLKREAEARPSPEAKPAAPEKVAPANQPTKAQILRDLDAAQKAQHKTEWKAFGAQAKAEREAIYSAYGDRIRQTIDQHKAESRALWAGHFRQGRAEERTFAEREKTLSGVVRNALEAAKHQQASGQIPDRGTLSLTFANVLSSQARAQAFQHRQEQSRAAFSRQLKQDMDAKIEAVKAERVAALADQTKAIDARRADLIARQDAERAKIREAWKQIYTERAKDPAARSQPYRERMQRREAWKAERVAVKEARTEAAHVLAYVTRAERFTPPEARAMRAQPPIPKPSPQVETAPMKRDFDKAGALPVAPAPAPKPAPAPTMVSAPTPAPSPTGAPPAPQKQAVQLPKVDKAAEWAKTPQGQQMTKPPSPPVRKDWSQSAPANQSAPAKKDWNAAAQDKPRDIKPYRGPDKSQDYGPEQ